MTKNLFLVLLLLVCGRLSFAQCNSAAPVTHYLTQTGPGEIYRPNVANWKGGDTIKITGTNYSVIEFNNIGGDACRDLVIMPQTRLNTGQFRIKGNCRYIKVWGGQNSNGIRITGGSLAITKSHHITADNMEISGGSVGVYCKQDYDAGDPETWQPGYVMNKIKLTNLWIHDINGEGMYVGHTSPNGVVYNGINRIPIRLDSVEISNCVVERTQWDGIQLSNARNGCKIFNNTVKDFGLLNKSSQQAGIILGSNTNADVYGNKISRGTGNGIELFGYGVINCYNNILDSCGWDGTANGQQSIYASDYLTPSENNPKQTVNIYNNTIIKPKTSGAVFVAGYANNSFPSKVENNKMCIANPPANWLSVYVKVYTTGSTIQNNVILCESAVVLPVKFISLNATKKSDKTYEVSFEVEEDANIDHYEVIVVEPKGQKRILKIVMPDGHVQGKKKYTQTIVL
ncbi:MAG: right-handed parallel beta-helix repeat-containing protein [Sphingobacteriales bacterium]|nr:MAG: right-handed parallel beta-helix repeat-containing protein [Sphingobacteriales bacterium]